MEADYDIYEVVKVIRNFNLFDAESYQRGYSTNQDKPLAPGFYIVNWPEHIRVRRFNEDASYYGPFESRDDAQNAIGTIQRDRVFLLPLPTKLDKNAIHYG